MLMPFHETTCGEEHETIVAVHGAWHTNSTAPSLLSLDGQLMLILTTFH